MPRQRKPIELHVVEGTLRPSRHGNRPPVSPDVEPICGPPSNWPALGKAMWAEIIDSAPAGVLRKSDRYIVELACRLIVHVREDSSKLTPAMASQIRCCLNSLGMTPSSRPVVTAELSEPDDKGEQFFTK